MASEIATVIRALRKEGYTVVMGRGGHWQVRDSSGLLLAVLSGSTKNRHTLANLRSHLRRAERERDA